MSLVAEEKDVLRANFELFAAELARADAPWLRELRTAAFTRFSERGFPTTRDEQWRETNVAAIARTLFVRPEAPIEIAPQELRRLGVVDLAGSEWVFVNGRFSPRASRTEGVSGLSIRRLRDVLTTEGGVLEEQLKRFATGERNAFALLNTAFLDDGVVIEVAAGTTLANPIHVAWVSTNKGAKATVSYPRALILARPGSRATIVESYLGPSEKVYLTNAVTEAFVEDGAHLSHVKLQREGLSAFHVATLAALQGPGSAFTSHHFALGAALARTDIDQRFDGEGGECQLLGLFLGRGEQVLDTHSRIDHAKPRCLSRELYKGVVDGRSRGIFNGLVVVRKDAQKTDAQQSNKNLLLSREALVHSTPQLEILADDVKCKHGSTTGQLDPASLFYLRSRGLGEAEAKGLLTWAFASELVERVPVAALRAALEKELSSLLPGVSQVAAT